MSEAPFHMDVDAALPKTTREEIRCHEDVCGVCRRNRVALISLTGSSYAITLPIDCPLRERCTRQVLRGFDPVPHPLVCNVGAIRA